MMIIKQLLALGLTTTMMTGPATEKQLSLPAPLKSAQPAASRQDSAARWADSVFNALTPEERIAQLIMIRVHSNLGRDHFNKIVNDIRTNKVGGVVFFQGGPIRQAQWTNYLQSISKVPLLVAIDAEWGLGMRLDSVISLPRNLMLGAMQDSALAYEAGRVVGEQCRRMGIHINFAPDMDVNNNPNNPVINDRSFGENKYQVARMGVAVIKGMQGAGIMACAKHFPGHGDTDVDSHFDLPTIGKTRRQLDSLELYPFRKAIEEGVGSVMVAHLFVPAIDKTPNTPTSISRNTTTRLLKEELGFKGLVITDALDMKGITKFYNKGEESLQSLLAGNDLMELPTTAGGSVEAIKRGIKKGQISWNDVNARVKRVLMAKYRLGLYRPQVIDMNNLAEDLNAQTDTLRKGIAAQALTLLRNDNRLIPFSNYPKSPKLAVVAVGVNGPNTFLQAVKAYRPDADTYQFSGRQAITDVAPLVNQLQRDYKAVIISLHNYERRPANSFGISMPEKLLIRQLQQEMPSATVVFGNPYAIQYFCEAPAIVAAYEDDEITQKTAADLLFGKLQPAGKLPVTVCDNFPSGTGVTYVLPSPVKLPETKPEEVGMRSEALLEIDRLARDMIAKGGAPGCRVLAMKDGRVVYNKCFGFYDYSQQEAVTPESVYDMASVTKICATTISVMRMYDQGKLRLDGTLGDYLPWVRGTDKADLRIQDILLHQAGLVAYIPFYKETLYPNGYPDSLLFHNMRDSTHTVRVADKMYMDSSYIDTMFGRILDSHVNRYQGYVYSDNDFIFLGKIVEQLSGKKLNEYVRDTFYYPMGLVNTGFRPRERFPLQQVAPTEFEHTFRMQWIRGDVHDPGAAMFGGVAGHAGLFSDAQGLAVIMQMLLNGGLYNGIRFIKPETIQLFTAYGSRISRRGLGFDKPEKDNATRREPYPCASASPLTFGHTGFTGTCVWADPKYNLVFVFQSNRVCPNGGTNLKLSTMHVRENMLEVLYRSLM